MKRPAACMLLLLGLALSALGTEAWDCADGGCEIQPAGAPLPPTAAFNWLPDGNEDQGMAARSIRNLPPSYKERFLLKSLLRQMGVAMRLPPLRKLTKLSN
ncbi:Hypp5240 [Branchiostoma lanceolatum]|uniref:Hypp5240 protein n=1 Tax=Branchiostoma lanceolatum TaxID=7740 RepID=A0A8K0F3R3_BRALA|nr:Hypp5240 [Branchiostoma lanceolatum]